jgi:hypothetical protein
MPYWLAFLFEFGFQGFYFLLLVEFPLAKGFTGHKMVILHSDSKELPTLPAPIWPLIT